MDDDDDDIELESLDVGAFSADAVERLSEGFGFGASSGKRLVVTRGVSINDLVAG